MVRAVRNPLPQLITVLKEFVNDPLLTLYELMNSYQDLDPRIARILLKWVLTEKEDVGILEIIINEILGDGAGLVIRLLPEEFKKKLERAHIEANRKLAAIAAKGFTYNAIKDALGVDIDWLKDVSEP